MTEPVVDERKERSSSGGESSVAGDRSRALAPAHFVRWMEDQGPALARCWYADLEARDPMWTDGVGSLISEFLELLVALVPGCLGPYRSQMEPLWHQASELFGNLGAMRGLAAGEIIEEFQLVREVVLRRLYREPPGGDIRDLGLREMLRLNRVIDAGVTHASIGHTDALFFALFQGSGVPESLTDDLILEFRDQLTTLEDEHESLRRFSSG